MKYEQRILTLASRPRYRDIESITDRRKAVQQVARSMLPNETEAPIIVTANLRAWRHFLEMRGSMFAETEIQALAYKVYLSLLEISPLIFNDYDFNLDINTKWRKV